MRASHFFLAAVLGASALIFGCVGDDTKPPADGGSDATTSDVVTSDVATGDSGGSCDGGTVCNGTCVDTTADPKNCGRCNHDCSPGKCAASACTAVVIDGTDDGGVDGGAITSITTDQTDDNPAGAAQKVFWAVAGVGGGVFQDNVAGGNLLKLSTSTFGPLSNVVASQPNVFWFAQNSGGSQQPVLKAQIGTAGSQASEGTMICPFIQSILFDATSQTLFGSYSATVSTHGVFKCALGSGVTCTSVTTLTGHPGGNVASDGKHVYFCDPDNGNIEQVAFTGNSTSFIQSQATPNLVRIDGTNIYWVNGGTKALERAALTGPTPKQLATSPTTVDAIAADAVNVYWTESATGTVTYAPITGAGPNTPYVTLGPATSPMRMVRDTGFLYFTHNAAIYRVALP